MSDLFTSTFSKKKQDLPMMMSIDIAADGPDSNNINAAEESILLERWETDLVNAEDAYQLARN